MVSCVAISKRHCAGTSQSNGSARQQSNNGKSLVPTEVRDFDPQRDIWLHMVEGMDGSGIRSGGGVSLWIGSAVPSEAGQGG